MIRFFEAEAVNKRVVPIEQLWLCMSILMEEGDINYRMPVAVESSSRQQELPIIFKGSSISDTVMLLLIIMLPALFFNIYCF